MVGREDGVCTLSAHLAASRFVTFVGPSGVGKTTVAIAVAHDLQVGFAGTILLADSEMLSQRHAAYYRRWLDGMRSEWQTLSQTEDRAPRLADLNNVRATLECLSHARDAHRCERSSQGARLFAPALILAVTIECP